MLQIANYQKAYSYAPVLTIPQLHLSKGIYWLKGENGAGKTTFLKSVAGLIPFDGEVSINKISLRKQRMLYTKNVSFAEAEPVYPVFLTGNDLLRFFRETKGSNEVIEQKIVTAFGMKSYLQNKIATYSSGMLKKLSLLLAFTGNPKLILLDEPFITLDIESISILERLIAESFENGISILISSHQQLELSMGFTTLAIHQKTIQEQLHVIPAK
ncbi:MAG: ABC transporter ATP-binding protein [Chitinophagaceae bacterium]|nr:MAG: ABC transporter ATP-binding protein [Chitinophagaceae bacterium]